MRELKFSFRIVHIYIYILSCETVAFLICKFISIINNIDIYFIIVIIVTLKMMKKNQNNSTSVNFISFTLIKRAFSS